MASPTTTSTSQSTSSYEDDEDAVQSSHEEEEQQISQKKKTVNISMKRPLKSVDDDNERRRMVSYKKPKNIMNQVEKNAAQPKPITGSSSKNPFEKLWSDADELVLLNGMIEFKTKTNSVFIDSTPKFETLLKSIEKSLSIEFTIKQVKGKFRKLKDKYFSVVERVRSGVKDPFHGKSLHEKHLYQLSENFWGDVKVKESKHPNVSLDVTEFFYLEQFWKGNNATLPPGLVRNKQWEECIGRDNAVSLNLKEKELIIDEMEIYLRRLELIKETTKLKLDFLKK
ncbi:hypothetical protein AQUCO_06500010v1 [Aquilegia coerulea]|uniref:Glabrous enhancer-binding protein-like DBD domain-containing protein n=1 Tax=Aquilegia coerulea TaxID=218851 RepID=A0A2G5CC64_AQUCA|nr:hypothetical protein AQUCO_06500010v1 [Aquilegia coerulea]